MGVIASILSVLIICSTGSEKVETVIKSYVESYYGSETGEFQYDFRRINWNLFPDDFDSVRVFRMGKESPLGQTIFTLGVYEGPELIKAIPVSIGVSMIVEAIITTVPLNTGEGFTGLDREGRAITSSSELPVTDLSFLEGKQAAKYIPAGSIIYPSMAESIPVINTGDKVNIIIDKGLIKVTAAGIAKQKGGFGDVIKVMNLGSKKILRGEIIDSTTVALK
jgi:flagella basal body P-ring formation protein FlgA